MSGLLDLVDNNKTYEFRGALLENAAEEAIMKGNGGLEYEIYLLEQNAEIVGGQGETQMKKKANDLRALATSMKAQYGAIAQRVRADRTWATESEVAEISNSFAKAQTALYKSLIDGKYPAIGVAQKKAAVDLGNNVALAKGTL